MGKVLVSTFLISLKRLESWFQRQKRVLPWRDQPSIYRVWISEIMLQQTQVVAVVPYFEKFIARFPSVEVLAKASEEEVMKYWAGLGYYSRARNLRLAAQEIVRSGRFPDTREAWLELPGIGPYTAGAILSIATHQPIPILDGNVERVLSRLRCVSRKNGDVAFKSRLWRISEIFVTAADRHQIDPSITNQALMELGATLCSPRKPACLLCPLQELCRAAQTGTQDHYPPKKKPKKWIQVKERLHCLLDDSGRVLLRRRQKGEWRAGLWDLMDDEPKSLGIRSVSIGEVETQHIVTRHKIHRTTAVWQVKGPAAQMNLLKAAEYLGPGLRGGTDEKWVDMRNPEVPVGSALKRTLKRVLETVVAP